MKIADQIKKGDIGILPTDTLYGIVGSALIPETVEKIYSLRKRDLDKPMIILISSIEDLKLFEIDIDQDTNGILLRIWPNKVSVVLPCKSNKFKYLHRGTDTLALRLPDNEYLIGLLKESGPIVAPSANLQGEEPAKNVDEALKYFPEVDFTVDNGTLNSLPSTLIELKDGKVNILRQGAVHKTVFRL